MYRNGQPDNTQYVSVETRRRLHILYLVVAAIALWIGITGMLRALREVGRPFGGFVSGWAPTTYSLGVAVEVPWHWPGPQRGLRGHDRILAVDGGDPLAFHEVFEAREVGDEITYLVARGDRRFTVRVPLSRFTTEQFIELYGFIFLVGLSCLLAGYVLVRDARNRPAFLVAFTLLALAGTPLFHGHNGSISRFYYNFPALVLLYIPSYPVAGALLTHFFFIFPWPLAVLKNRPWLVYLPYVVATALILFLALATWTGGLWNTVAFWLFLVSVSVGFFLCTARSLWSFTSTRLSTSLHSGPEGRGQVGGLGVAWAVGFLLLLGGGVIPFFSGGTSIFLTGLFIPLIILYPLILVYAVRNVQSRPLRREIGKTQPVVEGKPQDFGKPLTTRELEVLRLVARGATNKDIARTLSLSPHTVPTHLRNIYRKLEVRNRTAAVAEARRRGIL
ncbi:MAG: LuxR C-terminal-related transcriptional regulator [Anaerolineae bacterium]